MKYVYLLLVIFFLYFTGFFNTDKATSSKHSEDTYYNSSDSSYDNYEVDAYSNEDSYAEGTFSNYSDYPCTDDCSGHEAGYDWASEQGITDPDDCDGNSDSFIEGCQSYAEEQMNDVEEYEEDLSDSYDYEF